MKNQTFLLLITTLWGLVSCNTEKPLEAENYNKKNIDSSSKVIISPSPNNDKIENQYFNEFPSDSDFIAKIVSTGGFYQGDIDSTLDKIQWYGVFKNNNKFQLRKTNIELSKLYDSLDGMTGWNVKTKNKKHSIVLIEDLPFLSENEFQEAKLPKRKILPRDSIHFKYLDINYTLFVTEKRGTTRQIYDVYLTGKKTEESITELIIGNSEFADHMIYIILAGDIDGDGYLDLLINTSQHFALSSPTLYLSKPADKGHLLKPIGRYNRSGC